MANSRMKKAGCLLLLLTMALLLSGCQASITGEYQTRAVSSGSLILNEDNTFFHRERVGLTTNTREGTYEYDASTRTVTMYYEGHHYIDWNRMVTYRWTGKFRDPACTELALDGVVYYKKK